MKPATSENDMTPQERTALIARSKEIMQTMSEGELKSMMENPESAFLAMCATLATTQVTA